MNNSDFENKTTEPDLFKTILAIFLSWTLIGVFVIGYYKKEISKKEIFVSSYIIFPIMETGWLLFDHQSWVKERPLDALPGLVGLLGTIDFILAIGFYIILKNYLENKNLLEIEQNKNRRNKLIGLMKRTNKINQAQLAKLLNLKDNTALLNWLIGLPENFPLRLEGEMIILNPDITDEQINSSIDELMSQLDEKQSVKQVIENQT